MAIELAVLDGGEVGVTDSCEIDRHATARIRHASVRNGRMESIVLRRSGGGDELQPDAERIAMRAIRSPVEVRG